MSIFPRAYVACHEIRGLITVRNKVKESVAWIALFIPIYLACLEAQIWRQADAFVIMKSHMKGDN